MAKVSLVTLKSKFETGDIPTGADFVDLIDTLEDAASVATEAGVRAAADSAFTSALANKAEVAALTIEAGVRASADAGFATDLATKAEAADLTSGLALKANAADVYTKTETDGRIQTIVGTAPANLDTLQEIAAQLAVDESASAGIVTTLATKANSADVTTALADKADLVGGKVPASQLPAGTLPVSMTETKTAPAIAAGVLALDCAVGNVFAVALNANITSITRSNVPTAGTAYGCTVAFTMDGTARTIAWGASVKWAGGTAPTLTSTSGKVDIFVFVTWDGGSTWYGHIAGQNM